MRRLILSMKAKRDKIRKIHPDLASMLDIISVWAGIMAGMACSLFIGEVRLANWIALAIGLIGTGVIVFVVCWNLIRPSYKKNNLRILKKVGLYETCRFKDW